jgi:hypothetical protein
VSPSRRGLRPGRPGGLERRSSPTEVLDGLSPVRSRRLARRRGLRVHRHHLPPGRRRRRGARGVRPAGGAQRVPPPHRRRAVPGARPRPPVPGRRVRAAHGQRPLAEGRWLGLLLGGRSADPGPRRLPLRGRRVVRHGRPRPHRAAPHPRGAAAHPHDAQGGGLRGARVGRGRGAQPARRVRPDAGQPRARPVPPDRRGRRQLRRRVRLGLPGPAGGPEVRPRDLLPRRHLHGRGRAPDGDGQRRGRPRRPRAGRARLGPDDHGQEPHRPAHAQVRLQPGRRRPGWTAGVRGRGDPAGLRHPRGGGGPRRLPRPPPARLVPVSLALLPGRSARPGRRPRRARTGPRSPGRAVRRGARRPGCRRPGRRPWSGPSRNRAGGAPRRRAPGRSGGGWRRRTPPSRSRSRA